MIDPAEPIADSLMASIPRPSSMRLWPGRTVRIVSESGAPTNTAGMDGVEEGLGDGRRQDDGCLVVGREAVGHQNRRSRQQHGCEVVHMQARCKPADHPKDQSH